MHSRSFLLLQRDLMNIKRYPLKVSSYPCNDFPDVCNSALICRILGYIVYNYYRVLMLTRTMKICLNGMQELKA